MRINQHILTNAISTPSPHFAERPDERDISLLVIHNISLPPGEFGGSHIDDLFMGKLDKDAHPFFADIYQLRVSSHLLIRRTGEMVQYVPFNKAAWHAGVSSFQGRERCNDYSIGIELEGTDQTYYTNEQYDSLLAVTRQIMQHYAGISLGRIVGHCDIAPSRKTDPGIAFDWCRYRKGLATLLKEDQA